ncbi:hypothetical protein IAR55_005917 [Kwoniella newhampshirensis]|uniref:Glucan 1,3-beta-glucosidase n=1 Tax=Kwoniella newhampshirensis TaxID=1651941 RepID=A0AAW0YVC0_9TREE
MLLTSKPWITPSLFSNKPDWVVDEWTYGQYMSSQKDPSSELQNHWNTWFQYEELQDIANVGLNTIRIQIGCAYDYLKSAVEWAASLNLKIFMEHLEVRTVLTTRTRDWFYNDTNTARTLTALQVLTAEFTQPSYNETVIAIELINEPFPFNNDELNTLKSFYESAYASVRGASEQSNLVVALDEGFQGLQVWETFMTGPSFYDVTMDTVTLVTLISRFTLELLAMGYAANLNWYCGQADYIRASNDIHWTIVGEFTPANTDCAPWLNGRGKGARYDNTLNSSAPLQYPGDCSGKTGADPGKFTAEYVEYLAKSFETQTWLTSVGLGDVDVENRERVRLVFADWDYLCPIYSKPHG